jgi:hypothetical protein
MLNPVEQSLDGGSPEFRTRTLLRQRALVCTVARMGLPGPGVDRNGISILASKPRKWTIGFERIGSTATPRR